MKKKDVKKTSHTYIVMEAWDKQSVQHKIIKAAMKLTVQVSDTTKVAWKTNARSKKIFTSIRKLV